MPEQRPATDEFYVGYLPTPPGHLRVVRVLVLLMGLWIVGLGAVMAAFMRDPGSASWDTGNEQTWTGFIVMDPYPMLVPEDGSPALLLVEMGKHGAHDRLAPLASGLVEVRGFLLERNGRRIVELSPDESAIAGLASVTSAKPGPPASIGERAEMTGEIVDGKCYLGAMKPGDGRTHKACATLCIQGGLPPMFVLDTPNGPEFRLLIVDGSARLPDSLLGLVAERVRLEGEVFDLRGLPAVRVNADDIVLAR